VDIIYRDTSTHYPRRVRSVEASLGHFSARGKNKTEAKAALLKQIEDHAEHLGERRYIAGTKATFALSYVAGWQYDIIPVGGGRFSVTMLGDDITQSEALAKMTKHYNDYHGADPCPNCGETDQVFSVYRDGGSTLYCSAKGCDSNYHWPNPYFKRPGLRSAS
jgi:hypothetical protein